MKKVKKAKFVKETIDLPTEIIAQLAIEAHNRDMKLNDFIFSLLEDFIKKYEKASKKERKEMIGRVEHGVYK